MYRLQKSFADNFNIQERKTPCCWWRVLRRRRIMLLLIDTIFWQSVARALIFLSLLLLPLFLRVSRITQQSVHVEISLRDLWFISTACGVHRVCTSVGGGINPNNNVIDIILIQNNTSDSRHLCRADNSRSFARLFVGIFLRANLIVLMGNFRHHTRISTVMIRFQDNWYNYCRR